MLKSMFLILISICSLQASQIDCQKEQGSHVSQIIVTPKDIICEDENVFVEFKGEYYPVYSLVRSGAQWLATIDEQNSFCPRGHNVCRFCAQCHTSGCIYADLPPCWVRK